MDRKRPSGCVEFECLWLQSRIAPESTRPWPDDLRPDRCKGVASAATDGHGLVLHVDPGAAGAWRDGPLRRLTKGFVDDGRVVIVAFGGRRYRLDRSGEREVPMTIDATGMESVVLT